MCRRRASRFHCDSEPGGCGQDGAFTAIEGTSAFGGASLTLLRFTGSATATALLIALSLTTWTVVPAWAATRRLTRADL